MVKSLSTLPTPQQTIDEKKYSIKNLKRFIHLSSWAMREVYKIAPTDSILFFIVVILSSLLPVGRSLFNARLLDQIVNAIQRPAEFPLTSANTNLIVALSIVVTLVALSFIISRTLNFLDHRFRMYHLVKYENILSVKISSLDISDFEDHEKENEIRRSLENSFRVRAVFLNTVRFILSSVQALISLSVLVSINIPFAVIMTLSSVVYPYFFMKNIREDWDFSISMAERNKLFRSAFGYLTSHSSIKENRLLNAVQLLKRVQEKEMNFIRLGFLKIRRRFYKAEMFSTIFAIIQEIVSVVYPLILSISKGLTIGDYTFYAGRSRSLVGDIDVSLSNLASLYEGALGLDKVKNVMDMENKIVSGDKKLTKSIAPKIEFRDVSFKYPHSKSYALRNFSIVINPGEEIAIVGENGAGKTTFIKLLLRFYDVDAGEILIDGKNIKELDLLSYYKMVGALFQDYQIYDFLSINENVSIGSGKMDEKRVRNALKEADAYDFVQKLELKGKSKLGKRFKDGVKLSTGQEQKIALARMFYRDSPILILDEPTASIDAVAEYKIFKHIYSFMKNKTVIIVSHRFSTVRNAQKIYIFDKGRIIEEGSHKELLEKNGVYAKAFKLQAEGYTN